MPVAGHPPISFDDINLDPDAPAVIRAYVDGEEVSELLVLLRHPAFYITSDMGQHEYTRMYRWADGTIRCGDRIGGKVGPGRVTKVSFSRSVGLNVTIERKDQHTEAVTQSVVWSPTEDCQVTWTV